LNRAEPTRCQPDRRRAEVKFFQTFSVVEKYCMRKRMYIRSRDLPEPGIEARTPILSG
jgi:hypothetical protein